MSSYVFMKILESRPQRYDTGVAWISFGQAPRIKRRIVDDLVHPGMSVLDIGCGTGTLALMAAAKEARVTAFDVSPGMLAVARRKIDAAGFGNLIELREMGVSGMDHFADGSVDLIVATLVFSELSPDEQRYVLDHSRRVLKTAGKIALADEVSSQTIPGRLLHAARRLPMLIVTYALTQASTRAVEDLEKKVDEAGLQIERAERTSLGSFLYLVAVKRNQR
jgi:ubiquinone/menaquinone biosynthesis C-methylase UbiE